MKSYPEIKAAYPELDSVMEKAAEVIHSGVGDLMAWGVAETWTKRAVAKEHRQAVTEKLKAWIKAVSPCATRRRKNETRRPTHEKI